MSNVTTPIGEELLKYEGDAETMYEFWMKYKSGWARSSRHFTPEPAYRKRDFWQVQGGMETAIAIVHSTRTFLIPEATHE